MGSRAGSDSGGGGNDMQVSGAEAAYSTEKGISTAADTRISNTSFSRGNNEITGRNEIDTADSQGNIVTSTIGYGEGQVDPRLAQATLGADTSTVGIAAPSYSSSEIEKGYTDTGEILSNVNGKYMTKADMYSTGILDIDPKTGEDIQGRYKVNPNTGEFERADMTFAEHWANAPDTFKLSPILRFLYATGQNVGEYLSSRNFQGFNEAGQRGLLGNATLGYGKGGSQMSGANFNTGDSGRDLMNQVAVDAPYLVSGTPKPDSSPAANWYANLGTMGQQPLSSNLQTSYNNAKTTMNNLLGITPPSQQFGYSTQPYGLLSSTNMASNPFNIDYLKQRGLI